MNKIQREIFMKLVAKTSSQLKLWTLLDFLIVRLIKISWLLNKNRKTCYKVEWNIFNVLEDIYANGRYICLFLHFLSLCLGVSSYKTVGNLLRLSVAFIFSQRTILDPSAASINRCHRWSVSICPCAPSSSCILICTVVHRDHASIRCIEPFHPAGIKVEWIASI